MVGGRAVDDLSDVVQADIEACAGFWMFSDVQHHPQEAPPPPNTSERFKRCQRRHFTLKHASACLTRCLAPVYSGSDQNRLAHKCSVLVCAGWRLPETRVAKNFVFLSFLAMTESRCYGAALWHSIRYMYFRQLGESEVRPVSKCSAFQTQRRFTQKLKVGALGCARHGIIFPCFVR